MRYKEIERDLVGYFLAAVVAGILVGLLLGTVTIYSSYNAGVERLQSSTTAQLGN